MDDGILAGIASGAFNTDPAAGASMGGGNSMGPLAITTDPGAMNSPLPNQKKDTGMSDAQKAASGLIGNFTKGISQGAKENKLQVAPQPNIDTAYHALFTTSQRPANAPIAGIAQTQMQVPQMQAAPMVAPAPPVAAPMPAPQLAMSDMNAKKNIRPIRADIDNFLRGVYSNVIAKRK
jgi:hypothetical protein